MGVGVISLIIALERKPDHLVFLWNNKKQCNKKSTSKTYKWEITDGKGGERRKNAKDWIQIPSFENVNMCILL